MIASSLPEECEEAGRFQSPCLRDLARRVHEKPDAPALLGVGQPPVSFKLLAARIAFVAEVLRASGVRPGDIVAVAMPDGPEFLTALLGTMEAAAAAPLEWQLAEAELRSRLTLLSPRVLLRSAAADGHAAAVAKDLGIPVVELDAMPAGSIRGRRAPEECALLLQTSATTGEPKLVPLTQVNLHAICTGVYTGLELKSDDCYMSIMPLHHILGFSSALGQLMAGGSVACTGFDAQSFPTRISEVNATWYAAGPALHRAILEMAKQDPEPFLRSRLRFVRCGSGAGSPTLLSDLERVLQVDVVNGYGLTETGPVTNTLPRLPRKTGSVGRTNGPEIAIMAASGDFLDPNVEGEVVLRGDAVMDGYLGADEVNREAFLDGWFRTGDLGRMDGDGDLFITGRIKEIINRGGETISPLDIDHALAEHPGVLRGASFAVAHPTLGEDIVAAVVLRPGAKAVASEVRSFVAERLSRSKVPGRIWFVESIPLSASGKPLRDALRTRFQANSGPQELTESFAAGDESEALLRQQIGSIWVRVVGSDFPRPEDNFFAMGGDSLSAARLFALLQTELELDDAPLEITKFLDSPTFFQLVQTVAQRAPAETRFNDVSPVCLQSLGAGPPVFFFPGEAMEPWSLRHLARELGEEQPFFVLRHQLGDAADFPDIANRFVALLSQICPAGPILLAGHCYGGILAYDIAQRLIALSRFEVAVVLVDVETPGYPKARVSRYVRYLPNAFRAVLRGEGRKLGIELAEHFDFIRALRNRTPKLDRDLSAGADTPKSLTPCGIVLRTYEPQPFLGFLGNALALGREVSERVLEDSRKGWRELARGPFEERSLLGTHTSIFDAQNSPALASFLGSALNALKILGRS